MTIDYTSMVWLSSADEAARWLRRATKADNPLYPAVTKVLDDREARFRPVGAEIPVLPWPGGTSQADHFRQAAGRLQSGYAVGGSNMTATVVQLLLNAAAALDAGPVIG